MKSVLSSPRGRIVAALLAVAIPASAQEVKSPIDTTNAPAAAPWWNWHMANTDVGQLHPAFPAQYSGPNSLSSHFESRETVSVDTFGGLRLWPEAEFHLDGLAWQGFGLSKTFGIEAFPSAEAYKLGAPVGNFTIARAFIRQTFNLGGQSQDVADDQLHLAGQQDESRVVITVGEISLLDIFDNNTYASDPQSQFMNWAFVGNEAWDYPANSLGFITGLAAELYQPQWALRYGFFQMPREANGLAIDPAYLRAWGMVVELERHFRVGNRPGDVRVLGYVNRARMGSYEDAVDSTIRPADILATRGYRYKYGFCLNLEQEVFKDVGLFSRLGWSDGHTEAWAYSDVDDSASFGVSLNGELWQRTHDTFGVAGVVSAASHIHQQFLEDGGLGILAGDGALSYGLEKAMEAYYNFQVWKSLHVTADYQFISDPAFNRARGPVSVLGGRIHWDF
jgi:high affinity Mn2+ porin